MGAKHYQGHKNCNLHHKIATGKDDFLSSFYLHLESHGRKNLFPLGKMTRMGRVQPISDTFTLHDIEEIPRIYTIRITPASAQQLLHIDIRSPSAYNAAKLY